MAVTLPCGRRWAANGAYGRIFTSRLDVRVVARVVDPLARQLQAMANLSDRSELTQTRRWPTTGIGPPEMTSAGQEGDSRRCRSIMGGACTPTGWR